INDGGYGECAPGCVWGERCGDGSIQAAWGEQCDGGDNCDNNCRLKCGNRVVDDGEQCDDGVNAGGYGRCEADCTLGPRCGDGQVTEPYETCDEGPDGNDGGYMEGNAGCKNAEGGGDGTANDEEPG